MSTLYSIVTNCTCDIIIPMFITPKAKIYSDIEEILSDWNHIYIYINVLI